MQEDTFLTIKEPTQGIYKDKGSKFIAFAFPVRDEEEIKQHIAYLKKEHHSARHHCYAYRLGADKKNFRANDDGEPSNSAGKPILGQIISNDLTNILIVVVRYFGGILLGVGGLITAYKNAAADVIENSTIIEDIVQSKINITFQYQDMNNVMKIIKDYELEQLSHSFELQCNISILCRLAIENQVIEKLSEIETVKIDTE